MTRHSRSLVSSASLASLVLSLLAVAGCASGGAGNSAIGDALHADLATCPVDTAVGDACDPSFADCASSTDFAVACACAASADGSTHVACAPPLPVPAIEICAADVAPGVSCDDIASDGACVLPRGGRCVCREDTSDPRVPAGAHRTWACEVPPPGPTACEGLATGAVDCSGFEGEVCRLDASTRCTCASLGARAGASWICDTTPTVIPSCSSTTLTCASAPYCALDDGRVCRCIEDATDPTGSPRYECGPPRIPTPSYCPAEITLGTGARVECSDIGASCDIGPSGGQCRCVDDPSRDPSRPVGVWQCDATASGATDSAA